MKALGLVLSALTLPMPEMTVGFGLLTCRRDSLAFLIRVLLRYPLCPNVSNRRVMHCINSPSELMQSSRTVAAEVRHALGSG